MATALRGSLDLLSRRDKFKLLLVIAAQTFLALFDLVGIGLIGAVVALGTSKISGQTPLIINNGLELLGLTNVPLSDLLLWLSITSGILLVSKSLISFLITRKAFRFLALRQAIVSGNLIEGLLSQQLLFIQRRSTQVTTYALTAGATSAMIGVVGSAIIVASEVPVLLILGIGLGFVDIGVTIFTILFFGLTGLVIHRGLASQSRKLGSKVADMEIESLESVQESISSYKEIVVFGRRSFYVDRIKNLRWTASRAQGDLQIINQAPKYIYEIMLIVGGALLLVFQLMTSDLTTAITVITVFLAAATRLMPSLLRLQTAAISIISNSGLAETTINLARSLSTEMDLNTKTSFVSQTTIEEQQSIEKIDSSVFSGEVVLENVEFSYPNSNNPAISNFSVSIKSGSSLALVGPTGAGKSTIADLILGLVKPNSGNVLISNFTPETVIKQFPGYIAYVPQSTSVVRGNIRDNVALGVPAELVNDDQVWEALERAQLSQFLQQNRAGLETIVGERGVELSGGQRQRLGLARALYTRPKLLVLDEATSALDAETEAAITDALISLEGEVTTITIAHRLATIRNSDIILYIENGKEIARGSFDELRKKSKAFNEQAKLSGL